MHQKKFVLCSAAALLALAVACSKSPETPASPTSVQESTAAAAADGSTLKVPAPAPVSPINNTQPDTLTLVTNKVTGKFDPSLNPSYEFEIKTGAGATVTACNATIGPGSGSTVSYTPSCGLEFDAAHTWRVRAVSAGAAGPWSAAATFRTPSGGYISGNELFDPLTNGRTVGTRVGATQFIQGTGLELLAHDSRVTYVLPQTLQTGEFSVLVTGIDEGSPGSKTKVTSMQEGTGSDITDNDYRFTLEKRGRDYSSDGAVTWRMIMGEGSDENRIFDGVRVGVPLSDDRWYLWKVTWGNGRTTVEVREDGPSGRVVYTSSRGTGGFAYRPVPHAIHLGVPVGRAGPADASIPGAVYKNVWVSSRARPKFPGE